MPLYLLCQGVKNDSTTYAYDRSARTRQALESAIRDKLNVLNIGIERTRERLTAFEKQYGMTTEEFERRFDGQDLKETLDFIDWSGEIKMLHLLQGKYRALAGVQIG